MKTTKTQETEKAIYQITLTREIMDKVAFLDGDSRVTGREVYESYEIRITPKATGKTFVHSGKPGAFAFLELPFRQEKYPQGAYARLGNAYISQDVYDILTGMIEELNAENEKSDEQVAIENAEAAKKQKAIENEKRINAEQAERETHDGWCNKCHSYCYGDCEAN
jgi:hypothetical protein